MATTYDVGLRWIGGPAVQAALRDAERVRQGLGSLESKPAKVGRGSSSSGSGIAAEWQRLAAQADRAADKQRTAQLRIQAEAIRSANQTEAAKRNAAYRRLQQSQREEEQFVRYRIALDRKLVREKEQAEAAMLRAELRRINAAQRAEERAAAAQRRIHQRYIDNGPARAGGGALGAIGLASAGGAALAAGAYVGGQVVDSVKLIEGARQRLTASLGSVQAANKEIKDSVRIAEKTIFTPESAIESLSQLSTNFKQLDQRRYIFGAIADFATVSGKGEEGMKSAIIAINQIVAKGKLQQEELTGQLGELGLPARKVYDQLAVILGVKGKNDQKRTDKVIKMITAGKVGSDAAVQAITQVMRNQAGGGAAGSFAKQNAGTLEGQISNLKAALKTLFIINDIDSWPAVEKLKSALGDISGLFAADSKEGADFMNVLKFYANVVATSFIYLGQAMTWPIRQLYKLTTAVRDAISDYNFTGIFDIGAWKRLGVDMVLGLVDGIRSTAGGVYDAVGNLATSAVDTVKGKLGIQSPSRVMMALGGNTTEGFARGIAGGAGRVTAASRLLSAAATSGVSAGDGYTVSAAARASERAGSSATINNYYTFPIQTSNDPAELAAAVGPMIGARLEIELDRYFGRLTAQGA